MDLYVLKLIKYETQISSVYLNEKKNIKHAIEEMHEHGQKHRANRGNLTLISTEKKMLIYLYLFKNYSHEL